AGFLSWRLAGAPAGWLSMSRMPGRFLLTRKHNWTKILPWPARLALKLSQHPMKIRSEVFFALPRNGMLPELSWLNQRVDGLLNAGGAFVCSDCCARV